MLNYEEELKKFKPALAVSDVEDNIYSRDMTDVIDLLTQLQKTANKSANEETDR